MASPYVVSMENTFAPNGREYFAQKSENQAIGVFNPLVAKTFDTKAEARDWGTRLVAPTVGLRSMKIQRLTPREKQAFEAWVREGCIYRQLAEARDDLNIPYDANRHSSADILKWRISHGLADENTVLYENYESWPELYLAYHHLDSVGVFVDRDDSNPHIFGTPEIRVGIRVNPETAKFTTFQKELESAREAILEANPGQGEKFVWPIQDDESDGFESYSLVEDRGRPKGRDAVVYSVCCDRYAGAYRPEIKTESLKEVFEHIKKKHPYSIDIGPDTKAAKSSDPVKKKRKIGP